MGDGSNGVRRERIREVVVDGVSYVRCGVWERIKWDDGVWKRLGKNGLRVFYEVGMKGGVRVRRGR